MKIINLEEFRKLKPGTVFSKYAPCSFGEIMCKYETTDHDFIYSPLTNDVANYSTDDFVNSCELMECGLNQKLEVEGTIRDGMFEKDQLFAIYSKEDIYQLISKLIKCIRDAYQSKHKNGFTIRELIDIAIECGNE